MLEKLPKRYVSVHLHADGWIEGFVAYTALHGGYSWRIPSFLETEDHLLEPSVGMQ
jgi:hypothetical protein